MIQTDELYLIYGTHYFEMTRSLLAKAGLAGLIPSPDTLIGIKPNLVSQSLPESGATTHKEVVAGLLSYLQEEGFYNLVILESAWVGDRTSEVVKLCGYDALCEHYQVPFWDLQKDHGVMTDCGGMDLNICSRAKQIEYLINVPVLKGHCQTQITCALKNMKGLIPGSEKRRFHRLGLHDPIAHLNAGLHQDFILVDSICGDLTSEDGGNPVQQNRLIAGLDPVLVDAYGCSVIGLDPHQVGYLHKAALLGVGQMDLSPEKLTVYREVCSGGGQGEGGKTWDYLPDKDPAAQLANSPAAGGYRHVMELADRVEEVDSCSACYCYLIPALDMLAREGLLSRLDERICIGQGHRGKEGCLGVGNCTAKFRHTLPGCPPTEGQMYAFLRDYIQGEGRGASESIT